MDVMEGMVLLHQNDANIVKYFMDNSLKLAEVDLELVNKPASFI